MNTTITNTGSSDADLAQLRVGDRVKEIEWSGHYPQHVDVTLVVVAINDGVATIAPLLANGPASDVQWDVLDEDLIKLTDEYSQGAES